VFLDHLEKDLNNIILPYPRSSKGKKALSSAYAICRAKVKNKSKMEKCVYDVYNKRIKRRRRR
jgi:hypothetical protein